MGKEIPVPASSLKKRNVPIFRYGGQLHKTTAVKLATIAKYDVIKSGQKLSDKENSENVFIIISGIAKIVSTHPDGVNQIVGLKFASDFIGHPYSKSKGVTAEAASNLKICSFPKFAFERLIEHHPDLERIILKSTLNDLEATRDWMYMISRKTAEERLATLLIFIVQKLKKIKINKFLKTTTIKLQMPLSRTEVSECLGLRLETVSRQFAAFKSKGILGTGPQRYISILNLNELQKRAHNI